LTYIFLLHLERKATAIKININMSTERKKVTADAVIDLYMRAKKEKTLVRKEELMKKVIFLSRHLNEYLRAADLAVK